MDRNRQKMGGRGAAALIVGALGGFILGLVLFILFGVETSLYGVLPFVLVGFAAGGLAGAIWAGSRGRSGG